MLMLCQNFQEFGLLFGREGNDALCFLFNAAFRRRLDAGAGIEMDDALFIGIAHSGADKQHLLFNRGERVILLDQIRNIVLEVGRGRLPSRFISRSTIFCSF